MQYSKILLRNVLLVALVINSLAFVAQWFALSPNGHHYYIQYSALLAIPVIIALLLVPVLILLLISRQFRPVALLAIGVCVIYGVTGWSLFYLSSIYRMSRFEAVGEQSKVLVNAIELYVRDNGQPPSDLNNLVPRYIAHIPETGLGAYPDYEYTRSAKNANLPSWMPERRWNLYINIPLNGEQSEKFIYYPKQLGPQRLDQKVINRLGDWVYIRQ